MNKTFKHSGDLGDIIFSLPTIKALGGGILYLDPEGGRSEPLVKNCDFGDHTKLSAAGIESIKPLLLKQSYIKDVLYWDKQVVDYNLDLFRSKISSGKNLADFHLDIFGLDNNLRNSAWLDVDGNLTLEYSTVICRSLRYQSNHSAWAWFRRTTGFKNSVFLGHEIEHKAFEYVFDVKIPYIKTKNLLDVANILKSCGAYLGNANVVHAIAEGLKLKVDIELYRLFPSIYFERENASYF